MTDPRNIELLSIGSSNAERIPSKLFHHHSCAQCLYWEDPSFWTGNDPPAVLASKKQAWFQRTSKDFDPCGLAAEVEGEGIAFAEYALPRHFAGLDEYGVELDADVPFIACLYVAPKWQKQGLGSRLLAAVEADLESRGFRSVQTLARRGSDDNPSGPLEFWLSQGYEIQRDAPEFPLVRKQLQSATGG